MDNQRQRGSIRQEGSILVLALLVTLIILGIGLTVMWVANSGGKISGNLVRRQEALYSAEAGLERARLVLKANLADWSALLRADTCKGHASCGGGVCVDSHKGVVLCDGANPLRVVPIATGTTKTAPLAGMANVNYTVWIRNDWVMECGLAAPEKSKSKVDCDKDGDKDGDDLGKVDTDSNHRVILRAEGVGRDGLTYIAVEAIIFAPGLGGDVTQSYKQAGMGAAGANSMTGAM